MRACVSHAKRSFVGSCVLVLVALGVVGGVDAGVAEVAVVRITVSDLDAALGFYTGVLPFQKVSEVSVDGGAYAQLLGVSNVRLRVARLRLGQEYLELIDWTSQESQPIPADSRSNDEWFQHIAIIVRDMDRAYAHLRAQGVQHVSPGPQTLPDWNVAAAGIRAFYFLDPEGHVLEVLSFPPGKGDARWQRPGNDLFLGIDHTAIVVDDTETSLRFYRDALGLEVVGGSENYGAEQERLNSVFAARLRITTLRAAHGPGVELLEYLAPVGGRDYPREARTADLVSWQTGLAVADTEALVSELRARGVQMVSRRRVATPDALLGTTGSFLVRDPDGHLVHLMEIQRAAASR